MSKTSSSVPAPEPTESATFAIEVPAEVSQPAAPNLEDEQRDRAGTCLLDPETGKRTWIWP
jgi:hypothetical protein